MFSGWPRGRKKVLPTVRIVITGTGSSNNATISRDGSAPTTITYRPTAWVELESSTARFVNNIEMFDSTGYVTQIATGAAASEEELFLASPGGNSFFPIRIDAGERVSIRPTQIPEVGAEIVINFFD